MTPGGFATFNATITNNTGSTVDFFGIDVNYPLDTTWHDTDNPIYFQNFITLEAGASQTADLFQIRLITNPSQPIGTTYSGTVNVQYSTPTNPDGSEIKSFSLQSVQGQTPTPPVVLVTLFGGIGAARMALRKRNDKR